MFVPSGLFDFFCDCFRVFFFSKSKRKRKNGKKNKPNSSIHHLNIPLIVLGPKTRPTAHIRRRRKAELVPPVRLDPPVHVEHLVVPRKADLADPAVDEQRGVVFEREGDGLGLGARLGTLLLPPSFEDALWLLWPVGGASGGLGCLGDGDADGGAGDLSGWEREQLAGLSEIRG